MENVSKCRMLLNYDAISRAHAIIGTAEIQISKKITVLQIRIEVSGVVKCNFKLEKTIIKLPTIFHKGTKMSGSQMFYFSRHYLLGKEDFEDAEKQELKGAQLFPFNCGMPANLPPTWTGEYGNIVYTGRIIITDAKQDIYIYEQDLILHARRDLALETHLLSEARVDVHRKFSFGTIGIGTVDVSVWLPICGLAAGQSLPLLCTINNNAKLIFGGIVFVLTKVELYRSTNPIPCIKTVREDICRVARLVDILAGKSVYYCVLKTNKSTLPTNQFWRCRACQLIYEVWAVIQGSFPRYGPYNNPNIYIPAIPVIIGTEPLKDFNTDYITSRVLNNVFTSTHPVVMEPIPLDDEVEQLLTKVDEELDEPTVDNLNRQLVQEAHEESPQQEHQDLTDSIIFPVNIVNEESFIPTIKEAPPPTNQTPMI